MIRLLESSVGRGLYGLAYGRRRLRQRTCLMIPCRVKYVFRFSRPRAQRSMRYRLQAGNPSPLISVIRMILNVSFVIREETCPGFFRVTSRKLPETLLASSPITFPRDVAVMSG
jgi:hypothetical protein